MIGTLSGKMTTVDLSTSYIWLRHIYYYEVTEMRKPLVLIMVAFLCFPMFQFAHLISSSSQSSTQILGVGNSVVENGGFEQGLTGWANGGNGFLAVSGENPHSGNYSLEISSPINQQAYFYQYVDLPNNSFTFSFWLYRVDPKSWTACYLGRDWDGNTIRPVSSLIIQDDTIELNAWDNPYAPGRQVFNYDVTVGSWHNVTFLGNATLGNQDFYIDGNLVKNLNSSSGNVFSPNVLIFGDVSTASCNGTFYFDDIALNALDTTNASNPTPVVRVEPENVTVKEGAVFSVSVIIENIPADPGMVGVQFIMSWDPTMLSALNMTEVMFHNVTPLSEWDNIWELKNQINNTAGFVYYAYTWQDASRASNGGYSPISGNYTLATVTLEALKVGSTTLHFSKLIVGDPSAHPLICSSDVTYLTPLLPSLIVDGNVSVSISSDPKGDINGDGFVDVFDAILLATHFGSKQGDVGWNANFDLNGDGAVDILDTITLASNYGYGS